MYLPRAFDDVARFHVICVDDTALKRAKARALPDADAGTENAKTSTSAYSRLANCQTYGE